MKLNTKLLKFTASKKLLEKAEGDRGRIKRGKSGGKGCSTTAGNGNKSKFLRRGVGEKKKNTEG